MILPKTRDPRFITVRRGGSLQDDDHHLLAFWAADCAQHVLHHLEEARPEDDVRDGRPTLGVPGRGARSPTGLSASHGRTVSCVRTAAVVADPAITRPRKRYGTVARFSRIDLADNWLRMSRAGDTVDESTSNRSTCPCRRTRSWCREHRWPSDGWMDPLVRCLLSLGLPTGPNTLLTMRTVVFRAGRPYSIIGITVRGGSIVELDIVVDHERVARLVSWGERGERLKP